MLPDPAKPQPGKSPRDSAQQSGSIGRGLVSIATTLAIAILVHRINKKNARSSPQTTISKGEADPEAALVAKDLTTLKNSDPLPLVAESKPPIQREPYAIDIRSNFVDYGGLFVSFLSLIATVAIAFLAYQINWTQTQILGKQAEATTAQAVAAKAEADAVKVQSAAADDEVNIKFIEEFRERIRELSLPTDDENKPDYDENYMRKSLAIIALAQYGERVLPALKMTLESSDGLLRAGAVGVFAQMLKNQSDKESREKIFSELLALFDEGDAFMRVEILKCFVILKKGFSDEEIHRAKVIFKKHIFPNADLTEKPNEEQEILIEATKIFDSWPSPDSTEFLLAVLKNQSCHEDGPRTQAINNLSDVDKHTRDLTPERRAAMIADLKQLLLLPGSQEFKTKITNTISAMENE